MTNYSYWHKQSPQGSLFPDIEWQRPEQRALAGKLLIIGGNQLGFAAVATAYKDALAAGAGEVRAVLPDGLKGVIDRQVADCLFVPSNPSGGMSKEGLPALKAAAVWADTLLLIGDAGRNSETAIVLEALLQQQQQPIIITRDTLDLLNTNVPQLLQRENIIFIATFAQLQKLFQAVYYPKIILFSMSLMALVEALHKFTITYPAMVVVFHQGQLLAAQGGEVSTTAWENPLLIWRGSVAARAAVYSMQHPAKAFEAVTSSFI